MRQAANLAVDMDAVIKHVLSGLGDRVATAVNPMAFGFEPSLKPYRQDVERAKKLLAEAGYPNGFDVRFQTGLEGTEPATLQTNEAIVADLAKVGIRAQQQYIGETVVFTTRTREGKAGPMSNFNWGYYSVFDADAILHPLYHTEPGGWIGKWYTKVEGLDGLIDEGRSTVDQARRKQTYARVQRIIKEEAPSIFLFHQFDTLGISKKVEYEARGDEWLWLFDARAKK